MKQVPGYTLVRTEDCPEQHGTLTVLTHDVSGATILLVENEDNNKAFGIGFGTFPSDDTGVFHILEHSVLAGSEKYPVTSPFLQLLKSSMASFLNAMTFPDKTVYPFATPNETDFKNLMDVYLNAVFCPLAMVDRAVFEQEGWHRDADGTVSGVVYNEMQGALATPDAQLQNALERAMFPDTAYGVESGGDPKVIPSLSYEEFLDFHRKYYHPSNSYIYLYGNMDMKEKLDWLDREYLSKFDAIEVDSRIQLQKPFGETKDVTLSYPILEHEEEADNTYLSYNMVAGTTLDVKLNVAFSVLEYALLDAPGAPVKQALLDAQIGKDVEGSYEDGILQPYFQIVAKNANASDKERFLNVIHDTLLSLIHI